MKQYAWIFYIIFLLIIYYSFVDSKKYQGETAEDWFYKYDEVQGDFEDLTVKYNALNEEVSNYAEFVDCVESEKTVYRNTINKFCENSSLTKSQCIENISRTSFTSEMINEVNKKKIDCYDEYFE